MISFNIRTNMNIICDRPRRNQSKVAPDKMQQKPPEVKYRQKYHFSLLSFISLYNHFSLQKCTFKQNFIFLT